ncbi:YfcC family protein [Rosenbergiella australiborealis]|uniref:YfcC family protein n=1 Tax=Rosenbergiella australiborealis TaxID=1544696 RepID=A0ABS5T328_9GAMM|nr:YfcC family protein [Rosenbergiella australiborealis]MBT0725895.1 YfcC family protein [Rosenbergiella australiborealis]
MKSLKFPSAYTILFGLIIFVALLTWVIPAGQYQLVVNPLLGTEVPVAGTYAVTQSHPQGIADILLAPIDGLWNHRTGQAAAIDVALFILIIGGFLGVTNKTGAIDAGIQRVTGRLAGKEEFMIPILMALFALGGTIYGMAEESLPFYSLLVPVMVAARFDRLVAAATVLLGAGIGTLGSTINPFATVIAANAAGIPFTQGMGLRILLLVICWCLAVAWVLRYAIAVRKNPAASCLASLPGESPIETSAPTHIPFTRTHKIILILFACAFAVMIYGVSAKGWWMAEISAMFLGFSILIGLVARMGESLFTETFIEGAKELLGVALIIGIARGIVVMMDNGMITHTLLHAAESLVSGLPALIFVFVSWCLEAILSILVPSSSGLAVMSMPILAPLADFAGLPRDLMVTIYQSASGIINLVTPTSGVVMGGLAIAKVPYVRYLQWVAPLMLGLIIVNLLLLSISALI